MATTAVLMAALLGAQNHAGVQTTQTRVHLECVAGAETQEVPIFRDLTSATFEAPNGSLWRIEERGVELQFELNASAVLAQVGSRPSRLGVSFGRTEGLQTLRILKAGPSALEAFGKLILHCSPDTRWLQVAECLEDPEASTSSLLTGDDPHPWCMAARFHDQAVEAHRSSDLDEALRLYRLTIEAWLSQQDDTRAGAALLGLSEVYARLGRHDEALENAREAERRSRAGGIEYYALRARAQQCLALRSLGRFREAERCSDPLAEEYVRLGETSEAANALYTAAAMAREDGNQARARQALQRGLLLPEAEISDMVAGRLSQIGAGLAADSGHLGAALSLYNDALHRFERVGAPIWIGGAYLGAARLHAALGADAEAATLVAASEAEFRKAQAPERLAGALLLRGQIEAARGAIAEAVAFSDEAEQAYSRGSRQQLRLSAALQALSLDPRSDRALKVQAMAGEGAELPPRTRFDLVAGLAEYDLANREPTSARERLEGIAAGIPDPQRGMRFELLMARSEFALGQSESARQRLDLAIHALRSIAADVGSPALRQIVGRRLLELRAGWVATLRREDMGDSELIQRALAMIIQTQPSALLVTSPSVFNPRLPEADSLQQHLATALLSPSDDSSEAIADVQRLLWLRYRRDGDASASVLDWSPQRVSALQASLGPGELALVLGLSEPGSVAILLDREQLTMHQVGGAAVVRDLARNLIDLASDRNAMVAHVEAAARELSSVLLPDITATAPTRLWIVVDETLTAVPFGLLFWNGEDGPLAEVSRISVGPILPDASQLATSSNTPHVRVLTAASGSGGASGLPPLISAMQEATWLSQAIPKAVQLSAALDLDVLRRSLAVPGSWVHVAGHGRSYGGLQGYSGLWAEPENGSGTPSFISWLDLVDEELNAQLLVLNACDLAAAGAGRINRASSFAVALHAAGVDDVVAALWPVSDSAAALWVPAFYEELARQSNDGVYDPAGALAAAQKRLRASRMFRHPFYWASMVHIAGPRAHAGVTSR